MKKQLSFLAIISRDNSPILLEDYRKEKEISMHFIAHSFLDVIDEKGNLVISAKYEDDVQVK